MKYSNSMSRTHMVVYLKLFTHTRTIVIGFVLCLVTGLSKEYGEGSV